MTSSDSSPPLRSELLAETDCVTSLSPCVGVAVGVRSADRHSWGVVLLLSSSLSSISWLMRCSPSMVEVARLVASLLSYSASSASCARYCLCLSALSWSACKETFVCLSVLFVQMTGQHYGKSRRLSRANSNLIIPPNVPKWTHNGLHLHKQEVY